MKNTTLSGNLPKRNLFISYKIKKSAFVEIISSLLVLLFIYAALSKLLDYQTFKLQLNKSPFITQFAGFTAWALPVGEILVGLALILKRTRLIGLYASLFLMTMFTAYIYAMLHYSYYIPCSCGGILSKMDWHTHFWFNILFVVASIIGILIQSQMSRGIQDASSSSPEEHAWSKLSRM